ncbi:MAG: 4-(cytidine 5'-diphospho)-2-C-methyl-D-erythritol kinase [Gammaproteobacteria bacterium]
MEGLSLNSPAKLNLMLHITGRRADGYHLLQTVFQYINLTDQMVFGVTENGAIGRIESNTPVPESEDIALRAALELQRRAQVAKGVEISIDKRIPIGGGLGGGSSNAATTLLALNRLWELNLPIYELAEIGLELGADVPFFVTGYSAWATGAGEQLSAIELPLPWYLIIDPGVAVSTAKIFAAQELTRNCDAITIRAFLEGAGTNVCQPVACELYAEIQQAIDWLDQYSGTRMTGTGGCVFAPFDSLKQAESVKSRVPEHWGCFVAKAMNTNPVHQQLGLLE